MILPLLEEFSEPPVVVGHSFGGRVAVCLAASHPERIGPLVLTGVPLVKVQPRRRPSPLYRLLRILHSIGVISPDKMNDIRSKRGSADYRAAEGVMREILVKVVNESYEDELSRASSPMTLLWGADDSEVPPQVGREAVEIVERAGRTDASLTVVDGVGHHLPIEAPALLRQSVEAALR